MASLKQIVYGVTDFVRMRAENAYFVDRTDLIRELEKTSYTIFLRPRRFGKSLLVFILQCYYDVDYAHRFDELFGGRRADVVVGGTVGTHSQVVLFQVEVRPLPRHYGAWL